MKKDFEKIRRRGYDIAEFARVVQKLANAEPLEERYRDHALFGTFPHRHTFGLVQEVRVCAPILPVLLRGRVLRRGWRGSGRRTRPRTR
ncbi:MAG: type II toxin-antitoxin system mRNA interferase toxin, RelE/StbE family [Treponema sp.]|nr:type II toxin-antitoxin system mRNA interferase toxin, RelE/StbE family [Treponema sp.]